ncbi:MAG: hypothetical protein MRERC_4c076 [Mycoplasmataceae bacterium RC_NB112A]|nr:MAG: hypothetical protein MRERC_4c076 [Mycoplasmataceae bacterium RC_NB112A]
MFLLFLLPENYKLILVFFAIILKIIFCVFIY